MVQEELEQVLEEALSATESSRGIGPWRDFADAVINQVNQDLPGLGVLVVIDDAQSGSDEHYFVRGRVDYLVLVKYDTSARLVEEEAQVAKDHAAMVQSAKYEAVLNCGTALFFWTTAALSEGATLGTGTLFAGWMAMRGANDTYQCARSLHKLNEAWSNPEATDASYKAERSPMMSSFDSGSTLVSTVALGHDLHKLAAPTVKAVMAGYRGGPGVVAEATKVVRTDRQLQAVMQLRDKTALTQVTQRGAKNGAQIFVQAEREILKDLELWQKTFNQKSLGRIVPVLGRKIAKLERLKLAYQLDDIKNLTVKGPKLVRSAKKRGNEALSHFEPNHPSQDSVQKENRKSTDQTGRIMISIVGRPGAYELEHDRKVTPGDVREIAEEVGIPAEVPVVGSSDSAPVGVPTPGTTPQGIPNPSPTAIPPTPPVSSALATTESGA